MGLYQPQDPVKDVYPMAALQYLIADAALVRYARHHRSIESINHSTDSRNDNP